MKASEFTQLLNSVAGDPEIVTGEEWLPERLIHVQQSGDYLFCQFDNAPDEEEGEEAGRGFVEHEIELINAQIMQIFTEKAPLENKRDAILALILYAHERSSSEVVEMLGQLNITEDSE